MPDNEIEHEEDQIIEGGDEFDDAFGKAAGGEDESDSVNSDTTENKDDTETPDKEKVDDTDKDDKSDETDQDKDKKSGEEENKDKDKETPGEESEAIKRGKELLEKDEKEKKAREDQEAKEKEDKEKDKETTPEPAKPFTADDVKAYADVLKADDLPDMVEIDGEELDLKSYISDFPEVVPLITMTTQRILKNLVDTGVLVTSNTLNTQVSEINETIETREFNSAVYRLAPDGMDVNSTMESQDFKDWYEKEAKPEQKALFASGVAKDFALGLKEFDQGMKIKAAKDKNKDKDEADRKKKEDHDNLHKSTLKGGGERGGGEGSIDTAEQDFDSAFDEAAKGKK